MSGHPCFFYFMTSYGYFHHPPSATSSTAATIGSTTFLDNERVNGEDEIPELDERDLEPSRTFLDTHYQDDADGNAINWSLADEQPPKNFCNKTPPVYLEEKGGENKDEEERPEQNNQVAIGDISSYFGSYSGEAQTFHPQVENMEPVKEPPTEEKHKDSASTGDYFGQYSSDNLYFQSTNKEEHRQEDLFDPSSYFAHHQPGTQESYSNDPFSFYHHEEHEKPEKKIEEEQVQANQFGYGDSLQFQGQNLQEQEQQEDQIGHVTAHSSYGEYFKLHSQSPSFDRFPSEQPSYSVPADQLDDSTPKVTLSFHENQNYLEPTPKAVPSPSPNTCHRCGFVIKDGQVNFCSKCGNQLADKLKIESLFEGLSLSSVGSENITPVPTPPIPSYQQPASMLQRHVYSVPKSTPSPVIETHSPSPQQPPQVSGHPVANFGFGGKMYYTFPKEQTRYSATKSTTTTKYTPDVLHVSEAVVVSSPPLFGLKSKDLKDTITRYLGEGRFNAELLKVFGIVLDFGTRFITNEKAKERLVNDVFRSDDDINYSPIPINSFGHSFRDEFLKGNMNGTLAKALSEGDWLGAYIAAQFLGKEANSQVFSKLAASLDTNDPLRMALLLSSNDQKTLINSVDEGNWKSIVKVLVGFSGYFPIEKIISSFSNRINDINAKSVLAILSESADIPIHDMELLELFEAILITHNSSHFNPNLLLDKLQKAEQLAADSSQIESVKKYIDFMQRAVNSSPKAIDPQTLSRIKSLQERHSMLLSRGLGPSAGGIGVSEKKGWSGMFYDAVSKFAGVEEESTQMPQKLPSMQASYPPQAIQQGSAPFPSYGKLDQSEYDYYPEPYLEPKTQHAEGGPYYPPVSSEAYYPPVQPEQATYPPFISTQHDHYYQSHKRESAQVEHPIYPEQKYPQEPYKPEKEEYPSYPQQFDYFEGVKAQPQAGLATSTLPARPQQGYGDYGAPQVREEFVSSFERKASIEKPSYYDSSVPESQFYPTPIGQPEPTTSTFAAPTTSQERQFKPSAPVPPPSMHHPQPSISITKSEEAIQKPATQPGGRAFFPMPNIPAPLTSTGKKQPFVPSISSIQPESSYSAYSSYAEISQPEPLQLQAEQGEAQEAARTVTKQPKAASGFLGGVEEDDLGFGNKKIQPMTPPSPKKASEIPSADGATSAEKTGVFGFLKKLNPFSGSSSATSGSEKSSASPKATKANLGESNRFYFDPVQKRWIDQKAGEVEQVMSVPPHPPITSSPAGAFGGSPSSGSMADVSSMGSANRGGPPSVPSSHGYPQQQAPATTIKSKYVDTFSNTNEPTAF